VDGNVISTLTVRFYDNRNIDVVFDKVDGIQAKQIDIVHRLAYRELTRMRAAQRQRAGGISPPAQPPTNGAAKPQGVTAEVDKPTQKKYNAPTILPAVTYNIPAVSSGFADMGGVPVTQAEKDALAGKTTTPVIKK